MGKKRRSGKSRREDAVQRDAGEALQQTPPDIAMRGIVVRAHGLWYEVRTEDPAATWIATMRGVLKKQARRTDIVAVGDHVWITDAGDGEAVIASVEPRHAVFARTARNTRDTEQVILANPDQVVIVFAVREPEPHLRMLDRFIILAERHQLPIRIVVTKTDLEAGMPDNESPGLARQRFGMYEKLYPVHFVSSVTGEGVTELEEMLRGRISVVAGPSGVGKSSLLNVLDPDHRRDTAGISDATGKGRHTTIGAQLHETAPGTFIADTPGIRSLAMYVVPAHDLEWYFREFRPFLQQCRFRGCSHVHEPGCAIRAAVDDGEIAEERYASYCHVYAECTG